MKNDNKQNISFFGIFLTIFILFALLAICPKNSTIKNESATATKTETSTSKSYSRIETVSLNILQSNNIHIPKLEQNTSAVKYPSLESLLNNDKNSNDDTSESSILNVKCTYDITKNNIVGNEWSCIYSITGDSTLEGTKLYAKVGDSITIKVKVVENDSAPDIGTGFINRVLTKEDITEGFTEQFLVQIKENKGRYTGNIAFAIVNVKFTVNN